MNLRWFRPISGSRKAPPRRGGPGLFRRFLADRHGATAIEVALIAPPFLFLLMATFQIGLVFAAELVLDRATADVSRSIRTGQAHKAKVTQAQFREQICEGVRGLLACDSNLLVDVQALPDFSAVSMTWPVDMDGSWSMQGGYSPGGSGEVVVVRAFYQYPVWLPYVGEALTNLPNGKRLLASAAAFRNEPF